ncbi:hypothetical protein JMJ77_0003893 [Colletotrichum scovillei]|uniref:F-box domain-containing protein n=1 Tax=Colletotrichum scovillei TaxID=1209932 RepID=A0A9P7QYP6_9PEZI|nr:hypothetical protein JMJ77_0003893 [Colletotrichum scovillei]KAG7049142.1 hypothetical protein JMJ78_0013125 [Colletotrichum scovillei]
MFNYPPPSALENLPADILLGIISFLDSLSDLNALVNASSSLRRFFIAERRRVIRHIVHRDAAAVLKDAVALALIPRAGQSSNNHAWGVVSATKLYAIFREDLDAGTADISSISADHLIEATRCDFMARDFVTLYTEVQRQQLWTVDSEAAKPLTKDEEDRLVLACLRYQLLTQNSRDRISEETTMEVRAILNQCFTPCQIEQIVGIHDFAGKLHQFFVSLDASDELDMQNTHVFYDITAFRHILSRALTMGQETIKIFAASSTELKCLSDHQILRGGHQVPSNYILEYFPVVSSQLDLTLHTLLSHEYEIRRLRDVIYGYERRLPAITTGDLKTDPPFAWVDAHAGLDCRRWGSELLQNSPDHVGIDSTRLDRVKATVEAWRQLGFLYWDRDRVQLLKRSLLQYRTGWLRNVWDRADVF